MSSDDLNRLTKIPHWLAKLGSELDKLRRAAVLFWQQVEQAIKWPSLQLDPLTAQIELVHLLAWERDITPIANETELLFRVRVKYALQFAKGAGSKDGWQQMFKKLGLSWVNILERQSAANWDLITLQTTDEDLSRESTLLLALMQQYGKTCRRYNVEVSYPANLHLISAEFGHRFMLHIASAFNHTQLAIKQQPLTHNSQIFIASLESKPQ